MRRRKKGKFNLAFILMIITSVCLSTVQVGLSFLNNNFLIGGIAKIISGQEGTPTPGIDAVLNSNEAFIEVLDSSGNGSGFTTIIRSDDGSVLNNYLKFNSQADELWRIIGWTDDGIKIVKDTSIETTSSSVWDTGSRGWVPLINSTLPQEVTITSLNNVSTLCKYLNYDYYLSLIDPSSKNYINPNFINHTPVWNLTPMYSSGTNNFPQYANSNKSALTCSAMLGAADFYGLPLGILTVEEIAMVSNQFDFTSSSSLSYQYSTFTASWLKVENGITELTMNQRHSGSNMTSLSTSYSTVFTLTSSGVRYLNKSTSAYFRPTMYIKNTVNFTTLSTGVGSAGSATNPFILSE